ncbi:MAG TPA: response regulator [Candidatus Acidoferrales bacterium]|nr:response regulator [Candidatus Acidoferrales bacterium]
MILLVVEDNPTDLMLLQARLHHSFPKARIMYADDPHQLKESLKCDNCDVVVTDYWLGWTDGLSVLQRVRERWPRVRVIFLTGNGGEEVVAGAFKYGIYHYLLKPDGFDEITAVAGAAFESKRREDAHELMARIVESFPSGVHSVSPAGTIIAINAAARALYGYADDQIIGRSFEALLPAGLRDKHRLLHEQALAGEVVPRFPTVNLRRDGTEVASAMTMVPIRGADGGVLCVAYIANPIADVDAAASADSRPERSALASARQPTESAD